jgi:hypothetical protein
VYVVDTDAAPDAVPSRAARVADFGRGTGAAMRYLTRQSAEAVVVTHAAPASASVPMQSLKAMPSSLFRGP